jgi:hypothetical protein
MLWNEIVHDIADLKNKRMYPKGSYCLFLTCWEKIGLIIYTYYILSLFLLWSAKENPYILEWLKRCQNCSEWVYLCFYPKADWFIFAPAIWLETLPRASHTNDLAWLGLTRSCCRSKSQTQALINHTDTNHKLRQHSNIATLYNDTHFLHFTFSWVSWRGSDGPE